ncbi:MAG TPA: glucose 1-dehydrogenase [Sporolactobacillaceae bacterium]|nr:glucose 1-dehydrogenase [Sporolactobacillaceae bacterium]
MNGKRVVVVTGGANGIGKGVAEAFASRGNQVVIADIDQDGALKTIQGIEDKGGNAAFILTDVSIPEHITRLFEQVQKDYGRVDVLINNAGVSRFKPMDELTVDEWDQVININLRGYFLCAKEASRIMKQTQVHGAIVNIASTRAIMSEKNSEAYAATKAGIIGLTHALAASLSDDRITVNAVSPGWIETKNYDALSESDHGQHLSKRVGKPADIAKACLYLTDVTNDFVTGINLIVDGGMTRKMIYEE